MASSAATSRARSELGPRRPGHVDRAHPSGPIGPLAFTAVVVASLGGPLALAALYVPTSLGDASASAGVVALGAVVVFTAPLLVWVRYSRHVAGPAGLTGFVEAAAGRRVASVQAALWILSYLLYLLYTTATVVYDTLPVVLPGIRPVQPLLEVAIPAALAAVVLAGRTVTVAVIGTLAALQMMLVVALAMVTISHSGAPASYLPAASAAPTGAVASATGLTSLLFVCGSLPVFLGGEVAQPRRTVSRGLTGGFLVVAAGLAAVVTPLAANPAFTHASIPGVSMAQVFAGRPLALAVGIGVAGSIVGLMLVEFLALSRLLHALTRRPVRVVNRVLVALLLAAAPVSLLDPEGFYTSLLEPSLVALWLSLLLVFAVYPRFAARRGGNLVLSGALAAAASAFAVYGLYASVTQPAS